MNNFCVSQFTKTLKIFHKSWPVIGLTSSRTVSMLSYVNIQQIYRFLIWKFWNLLKFSADFKTSVTIFLLTSLQFLLIHWHTTIYKSYIVKSTFNRIGIIFHLFNLNLFQSNRFRFKKCYHFIVWCDWKQFSWDRLWQITAYVNFPCTESVVCWITKFSHL